MDRTDSFARGSAAAGGRGALMAAIAATGVAGAAMLLLPGPTRQLFAWILYGDPGRIDAFASEALHYVTLAHGVIGAVMVGWAVALAAIVRGQWAAAPRRAWSALALSVATWFVLDSGYSIAIGAWRNAVFNGGFAIVFAVALAVARTAAAGARSRADG